MPTPKLVAPKTYLVGVTCPDMDAIKAYLADTGQSAFLDDIAEANGPALIDLASCMVSMFAKLCYSSLVPDRNQNVKQTRSIKDNIAACFDHGHGSVFEHVSFNFITTGCSRVFTHELVRHRAGTAFSQQSGRYVMSDFDFVFDPILDPVRDDIMAMLDDNNWRLQRIAEKLYQHWAEDGKPPMALRKKITSAIRRLRFEGRTTEMAWTANIRAVRHMIQARTSEHAEWEIRVVFCRVFDILRKRWPELFADAQVEYDDGPGGLFQVTGMKMQPYERSNG